ncbi:MAG: hypothetical protein J7L82_02320 [Staphylothermus sp.]|nr:hypothetical protein [Staphylothermus sp.]
MKACLDEVSSIREKYSSFLKNIRELAQSAIRKLGLESWNEGQVYINRVVKKSGKCYAYLEIRYGWRCKKVGLGPCDKFDKQKLYSVLKRRFGITEDEVNALFLTREIKSIEHLINEIEYYAYRLEECVKRLNLNFGNALDEQITKVKQPVIQSMW